VVCDLQEVNVTLASGDDFVAKVVSNDPATGLAILKIKAVGLKPIELADSHALRSVEWAIAMSFASDQDSIFSKGLVWLHDGAASTQGSDTVFFSYHFPAVRVEPGSALINQHGQLIGIDVPPPLLFKDSSGARYGLTSSSALAAQRRLTQDAPLTDEFADDLFDPEDHMFSMTRNSESPAEDFFGSGALRSRNDSARQAQLTGLMTSRWNGEPISRWVEWFRDKLSSASKRGGDNSPSATGSQMPSG
jgi:hypothetical protein